MAEMVSKIDFTYDDYRRVLEYLDTNYTWTDYEGEVSAYEVILRHDVDYSPRKAVRLAEIEAERGVTGTYFFLLRSQFYNVFTPEVVDAIQTIEGLGHDIGLHFSTHAHWEEEPASSVLYEQIETEFELLQRLPVSIVRVVAFHNPPDWTLRRAFKTIVSTYEPQFFDEITYVADSNQRWRETDPFVTELPPRIQLLVHPALWGSRPGSVHDRLREERDYVTAQVENVLNNQNDRWNDGFDFYR
jgi:hypothetical protein